MRENKIMVYTNEDGSSWGYRPCKFNFEEGRKVLNQESGKIMIVKGVYDLGENSFLCLKRIFGVLKNKRVLTLSGKVAIFEAVAIFLASDNGEEEARNKDFGYILRSVIYREFESVASIF